MKLDDKSKVPDWLAKKYGGKPASLSHAKASAAKPCDSKTSCEKKISLVKGDHSAKGR